MLFTYEQMKAAYEAGKAGESFETLTLETIRDNEPMENANFCVRLYNAFRRAGIKTIGEARIALSHNVTSLSTPHALDLPNIGWKSYAMGRADLEAYDERFAREIAEGWVD